MRQTIERHQNLVVSPPMEPRTEFPPLPPPNRESLHIYEEWIPSEYLSLGKDKKGIKTII